MRPLVPLILLLLPLALVAALLTGDTAGSGGEARVLLLAHNMDENHPVHKGMVYMARRFSERTGGSHRIRIYPNGQLGTEREVLELLQYGAVAMTKVSSLSLESFVPLYAVFNLPYIFKSKQHAFRVLDGPVGADMLASSRDKLFIGLTYYDSGARSFYARVPIRHPDDLAGLKIRVMGSRTAIRMLQAMGGSPAPMPYGEIYTALQQGVIDGAENNITALSLSRHGEVARHYALNGHIIAPDVLIISTRVLDGLPPNVRDALRASAVESRDHQRELWRKMTEEMMATTRGMGVTIHRTDPEPFRKRVLELHTDLAERGTAYARMIDRIQAQP